MGCGAVLGMEWKRKYGGGVYVCGDWKIAQDMDEGDWRVYRNGFQMNAVPIRTLREAKARASEWAD